MQDLRVSLLQRELVWENPDSNREKIAADVKTLAGNSDLIVLPEMFTSGFSMDAQRIAEPEGRDTMNWLLDLAGECDAAITGSIAVSSTGGIYNRLLFATPSGDVYQYDKRHLFRMAGEHERYRPGSAERLVIEWRDWRIFPLICYDLRFPVFSRNRDDYDLLLYVANWPAKRRMHWRQLLIARAIENQAVTLGVNRIGTDGNGVIYSGDSLALAADGELLLDCEDRAGIFSTVLDAAKLNRYRQKFPCQLDADSFTLD